MQPNRTFVGWGLFFIAFGGVLLAVRQGAIPTDVAARSWQLWPLLLVAAGLSMILSGRPGGSFGGFVAAVTFGVIAGGLIGSGANFPFVGCGGSDEGTPFAEQSGALAANAVVQIEFRCGELTVDTTDGSTWTVDGVSVDGEPPTTSESNDGIRLEAADSSSGVFGFSGVRELWTVTLPTDPTIELDVVLNAGSGRLTLRDAHLGVFDTVVNAGSLEVDLRDVAAISTLDGTVNAGSVVIWLPDRPLEGNLTVNAGSLSLCAPEDVGLRFTTGANPISSNNFDDQGLVRVGDAWETSDFATAPIRIALDLQANAGSLSLDPRQECTG
jgi:hypothetical protein